MKKTGIFLLLLIIIITIVCALYLFNVIPHKKYENSDFNIETYKSKLDKDNDGIDDQTDILKSAKSYVLKKPKYKNKYYAAGYPDDEYGVCADVIAFALKDSGYDLMELVNDHIKENRKKYNIDKVDRNIDFRRVNNLKVYFENTALKLTNDLKKIGEWQGGDIVIFKKHIAIVSDKRNKSGIPFIIHNANPYQISYEQDILSLLKHEIVGHYRIS